MGQQERAGVHYIGRFVELKLDWIFREQTVEDIGIDAHMEERVVVDHSTNRKSGNGKMLGIQIKSGPTYLTPKVKGDAWLVEVDERHVNYWLNHTLKVLMVVVDNDNDQAYWTHVIPESIVRGDTGIPYVSVPRSSVLTPSCGAAFSKLAAGTQEELNLVSFALFSETVGSLAGGEDLWVEVEEWVNKSSGRIDVRVLDSYGTVQEWTTIGPGSSVRELLEERITWADIVVDEDHYDEFERDRFKAEYGSWDRDDEVIHYDEEECEAWIQSRAGTDRPYEELGEVERWRFKLSLNETGTVLLAEFNAEIDRMHDEALGQPEGGHDDGEYVAEYHDFRGNEYARISYYHGDEMDIVFGTEGDLWTDDARRRESALALLAHHLGRHEVSGVVITAFVNHFNELLDSTPDWSLTSREVSQWLEQFH